MKITTPHGTLKGDSIEAILEEYGRNCLRGANLYKANLINVDLTGADLSGADLRNAYMIGVCLRYACLIDTDLRNADMTGANLWHATMSSAGLCAAVLNGANMCYANLRNANLHHAVLRGARARGTDLRDADLLSADLRGCNMFSVDLTGARLTCADLAGAVLTGAKLSDAYDADIITARTSILPDDGDVIGWKKARDVDGYPVIVKLLIPSSAQRSNAGGRKCRVSKARVLDLQDLAGHSIATVAHSAHDPEFVYRLGETVESDGFNPDRWVECTDGIHFFITRIEAVKY